MDRPLILIICTGNSCRSHMAEGFLRASAGDIVRAESAGSQPAGYVHPNAIAVMKELAIDISDHHSKHLDTFLDESVDTVITVCDNAAAHCPVFPGKVTRYHWPFQDPAVATGTRAEVFATYRSVRDAIRIRFDAYADELRKC